MDFSSLFEKKETVASTEATVSEEVLHFSEEVPAQHQLQNFYYKKSTEKHAFNPSIKGPSRRQVKRFYDKKSDKVSKNTFTDSTIEKWISTHRA
jgi:hypothetical protein